MRLVRVAARPRTEPDAGLPLRGSSEGSRCTRAHEDPALITCMALLTGVRTLPPYSGETHGGTVGAQLLALRRIPSASGPPPRHRAADLAAEIVFIGFRTTKREQQRRGSGTIETDVFSHWCSTRTPRPCRLAEQAAHSRSAFALAPQHRLGGTGTRRLRPLDRGKAPLSATMRGNRPDQGSTGRPHLDCRLHQGSILGETCDSRSCASRSRPDGELDWGHRFTPKGGSLPPSPPEGIGRGSHRRDEWRTDGACPLPADEPRGNTSWLKRGHVDQDGVRLQGGVPRKPRGTPPALRVGRRSSSRRTTTWTTRGRWRYAEGARSTNRAPGYGFRKATYRADRYRGRLFARRLRLGRRRLDVRSAAP